MASLIPPSIIDAVTTERRTAEEIAIDFFGSTSFIVTNQVGLTLSSFYNKGLIEREDNYIKNGNHRKRVYYRKSE